MRTDHVAFQVADLDAAIAFYTMLHVLTWAMVRYRLPVDAALLPFAALALHALYARGRRWLEAHTEVGEHQVAA